MDTLSHSPGCQLEQPRAWTRARPLPWALAWASVQIPIRMTNCWPSVAVGALKLSVPRKWVVRVGRSLLSAPPLLAELRAHAREFRDRILLRLPLCAASRVQHAEFL